MVQSRPRNINFYNPEISQWCSVTSRQSLLHDGSSTHPDKAFPGAFLRVSLNNQASGLPSAVGPPYLQAVATARKSPEITRGGKQKLTPSIQSVQVMVWQRLFWATDLCWGFSSQKTVNKRRGGRQHSLKKKKVWKGTAWDTDAVVWKLSRNTHDTGANSNSTAHLEQHPKNWGIFWLSYLYSLLTPNSHFFSLYSTRSLTLYCWPDLILNYMADSCIPCWISSRCDSRWYQHHSLHTPPL